jgi:NADPH:quinone reductase-like Zn-dependent oxidoreductase
MRFPACFAQKMNPDLTYNQAATMPIAFATALHALQDVARLEKDERVLIQTATGGLGLAALQIARDIGAEIFATVGSTEKQAHLINELKISGDHVAVLASRDLAASAASLAFFPGQTFDVVLNTGSGEILEESMRRLTPGGRLVDVGRVDVQNSGLLHMEAFRRNATFASFDLNELMEHQPDICGR